MHINMECSNLIEIRVVQAQNNNGRILTYHQKGVPFPILLIFMIHFRQMEVVFVAKRYRMFHNSLHIQNSDRNLLFDQTYHVRSELWRWKQFYNSIRRWTATLSSSVFLRKWSKAIIDSNGGKNNDINSFFQGK